jgi:isocitrate dehydrogenase
MDGQRLILVSGTYGAAGSEYRTELDSFSKIVASGSAGNGVASFTVQTKAGLTMEYGNTADSRIEAQGKTTVRVWAVNKIADVKTNFMTFTYTEDSPNGDYYPNRIDYSGNTAAGRSPTASVRFTYETRLDNSSAYQNNSVIKVTKRLTNLKTYIGESLAGDNRLTYEAGTSTKRSRLKTYTYCDQSGNCFAPVSLNWSEIANGLAAGTGGLAMSFNFGGAHDYVNIPADLNGDGKSDLLSVNTGAGGLYAYAAIGRGDGTFETGVGGQLSANNFGSTTTYTKLLGDFNGDGKTDILVATTGTAGFYAYVALGRGDGTFLPATGGIISSNNYGSPTDYVKAVGDFNGDGISDLVAMTTNGNGFYAYIAMGRGDGTFEAMTGGLLYSGNFGPTTDYVKSVGDFNGDGKSDLVAMTAGAGGFAAYVAIGRGDGNFDTTGGTLSSSNYGATNTYTTAIGDFNGDGKSDLIAMTTGGSGFYAYTAIGKGDGTFEPVVGGELYSGNFGASYEYRKTIVDLNGDGRGDLVAIMTGSSGFYAYTAIGKGDGTFEYATGGALYSGNFGATDAYDKAVADFRGNGKSDLVALGSGSSGLYAYMSMSNQGISDLLTSVAPGLGASTTLAYSPLTAAATYTKDVSPNVAAYPKVDLVFPQYVVSTVASSNGVGGTTTTQYNYGGLKAELGTGRGMLGFRWMKSKNLSNNIESYTEFNQSWPFTGSVLKSETRLTGSGNAGVLKRTTNTYAQGTGSATGTTFVYPSQSVEESWDLGGSQYPTVTNAYQYGQTLQYGDPTQISVSNSAGAGKTTVNEYWPANIGSGNWILGRLKKASVTSVTP